MVIKTLLHKRDRLKQKIYIYLIFEKSIFNFKIIDSLFGINIPTWEIYLNFHKLLNYNTIYLLLKGDITCSFQKEKRQSQMLY